MKMPAKFIFSLVFIPLLGFSFSSMTFAGDDGLYAAAPPPGSAFIRFVNGGGDKPLKGNIRGKELPIVAPGHAGIYEFVSPGDVAISFGGENIDYTLKPGGHYSAALINGHLSVLEEPVNDNKLKTQIILINLSREKNVSLKTADGSISVIKSVEPGTLGAQPVNPVTAQFAVFSGSNKIASLGEQSLQRGADYIVVVYDGASGPAATYDKAVGS